MIIKMHSFRIGVFCQIGGSIIICTYTVKIQVPEKLNNNQQDILMPEAAILLVFSIKNKYCNPSKDSSNTMESCD